MRLNTINLKDLNENVKEFLNGGSGYGSYQIDMCKYAPCNIPFNKLLYMKKGKELIAVKILMASYFGNFEDRVKFSACIREHSVGGWCLLLQTPYGIKWTNDYHRTRFFYTKEEYFAHLEHGRGGFEIETQMIGNLIGRCVASSISFNSCWKWNGHCAEHTHAYIKNAIINEEGMSFILKPYNGNYYTKEDCIKANIEGMKIIDFPETENSIKISVEVVKTPPIVRTLTFVEE